MTARGPRSLWHRLPEEKRAGTRIDKQFREAIQGPAYKAGAWVFHGWLDTRQSVYQTGGEGRNFILQKRQAVTLPLSVWIDVCERVDWIEVIDHDLNRCYRIRSDIADREGTQYNEGIGVRFAVPVRWWAVTDGPFEPDRGTPTLAPNTPTTPASPPPVAQRRLFA